MTYKKILKAPKVSLGLFHYCNFPLDKFPLPSDEGSPRIIMGDNKSNEVYMSNDIFRKREP
ncbi:hypothetical protein Runsl_3294 [Runella slithyformis DSM 19594]|uniref:Uncharacterized protein n=1 Tax=Runella slithyformis (strain ATCC 29530 / DSM 19594 / LMG 11500 / NCIMB 11436 / LSU 4) TaxID=761193 RepID=A0A7U4E6K5_RUNSL|nr:hypothetical protein Runsl_3294 [Runella slithyformis DSM 19594]